MILTTVPKTSWLPDSNHIYLLPGTPYDFARNQSYYLAHFHLKKTGQLDTRLKGCTVDYSRKVMYMYDESSARIEAIQHFDWRNHFASVTSIVRLHVGVSVGYVKLAVDWVSHNIYWTDPLYRWIGMQPNDPENTDRSLYKIIIKDDLDKPYGLAVDPLGGFIFWTDISKYPKIERATLTGKNREAIISSGLLFPLCIDVDYTGSYRRIYWADTQRDTVESADLNGGDRRIIVRMSHTQFYDIALFRDVLSVVDVNGNNVYFINRHTGQQTANPYTRQMETIWGICMYDDETQPQHTGYCSSARCSDLCVNVGGKASCLCRDGYKLNTDGFSCSEDTSKYHRALVIADSHSIYLADARCLTAVFSTYQHTQIYNTTRTIKFLAVDMVDRKIFYATDTEIWSVVVDMTNPQHQRIVTSQYTITGLSLDWSRNGKNVYWTSGTSSGRINVVSQNGGNSYTLQSGLIKPRGLKILALEEKMVWISGGINTYKIEISDLDGTEKKTVVPSVELQSPQSLDFDSHTNKLYWVDNGNIKKVNIDGSGLEVLPVSAVTPNLFLLYKDYLVWTEDSYYESTVISANAQDPKQRIYSDSFFGVGIVVAINVLDETLQPDTKGPCEADNGECEHICIPVGNIAICKCEYGFKRDSNGRTCSSEPLHDHFLAVTDWSHNKIYQVSLADDDDVRAIDIDISGNPNAVIFDSTNKRVIWGDTKDRSIWSANLNGSDHKRLLYYGARNSFADRFAIDTTSGNLYYTSVSLLQDGSGFKGVSVISPKGDNRDLVTDVNVPRDIVVDPQDGLMFWTDHGTTPSVKRANMDGTSVVPIITTNIKWPNGIAIDYQAKRLYLTDGHYNTIQKCSYSGSCTIIHSDPDAHLMDIELSGQYLYYTAWNRPYITKMNKDDHNDLTQLATNAELGRLDSISIYSSSAVPQPVNAACSSNEGLGDCSTLCLPTSSGRQCTCQNGVSLWPGSNICNDFPKCSSSIPYGRITGSCSHLHLSSCSYACNTFYESATTNKSILCTNGKWNVKNPCVFSDVKCPSTINNGSFNMPCTFNNGETCRYSCSHGYEPTAAGSSLTCTLGTWSNQIPCQKIEPDCPTSVDQVVFSNTCLFQNGEQCSFNCESGYFSHSMNLICSSGSWNVDKPCEEIKCRENVNRVIFEGTCSFTNGSTCSYRCTLGYRPPSGANSMTCLNGVWNNVMPCEEYKCPATVSRVIFSTGCQYSHGSSCSYTCQAGYTPTQSDRILTCNDGSWDTQNPCTILKCPSSISHGRITEPCSYLHSSSCSYTCDSFYQQATTNRSISCTNGEWNFKNPCIFSNDKCPSMDKVIFEPSCNYNNGGTCRYSCVQGYEPTAAGSSITCDMGTWNNQNPCRKIEPYCPTDVDHVVFSDLCLYQNGEQCSYNCEGGYLTTSRSMICVGGAWNVPEPCKEIKCHDSPDKVVFNGTCMFTNASVCPYSCVPGYRPTSSYGAITCVHGVWDNTSPCEEIKCPTSVSGVRFVSGCPYSHGSTCSYSCKEGYSPTQSHRYITCNDGSWDTPSPCKLKTTSTSTSTPATTITSTTTTPKTKASAISTPFISTSSSTEAPSESETEAQSQSVVPIAAGAGVGSLVLVAIVVAVVCFVCKRTAHTKHADRDTFFESPCYQGFDNLAAVGGLSSPLSDTTRPDPTYDRADRPNTTYDGIADRPESTYDKADNRDSTYASINDLEPMKGCSETAFPGPDYPGRKTNDYTDYMSRRKGVAPLSGEYESLHREESDYLQPVKSNPYQENFM